MPRTRGDGPGVTLATVAATDFAPHTRGWSPGRRVQVRIALLCPAHAGMVPSPTQPKHARPSLPRTRGDGPLDQVFSPTNDPFAPHTRGWSRRHSSNIITRRLCPAHAGMVPTALCVVVLVTSLPRTRGDGPMGASYVSRYDAFAPHTRGWSQGGNTQGRQGWLCPAHAGMVRD